MVPRHGGASKMITDLQRQRSLIWGLEPTEPGNAIDKWAGGTTTLRAATEQTVAPASMLLADVTSTVPWDWG